MQIIQATETDLSDVEALFWEYLQWANSMLQQSFAVSFDIAAMLEGDMAGIRKFYPPRGRLLVAKVDDTAAGCACVQTIGLGVAELKRTYVRPSFRGRGIGKALMHALAADLRAAGYHLLRLDSANFMTEAHALYRSVGFVVCEPYAESEIPQEFHANWTFMERALVS